jgi:hypothetical protein
MLEVNHRIQVATRRRRQTQRLDEVEMLRRMVMMEMNKRMTKNLQVRVVCHT